jgi:hypothetical protein
MRRWGPLGTEPPGGAIDENVAAMKELTALGLKDRVPGRMMSL